MDPLNDLYAALTRGRNVEPWLSEHAPDGDLRAAWEASTQPVVMLHLVAPLLSAEALVLATAACVRILIGPELVTLGHVATAITVAEGWARGAATKDELDRAVDHAMQAMDAADLTAASAKHDPEARKRKIRESDLAYACASVAHLAWMCADGRRDFASLEEDLRKVTDHVVSWNHYDAEQAKALRAHLPLPTLAQLRASYGPRSSH